uniref:Uncharacterized protein n=1 Tax=Physcomitrium patens TaxID=3218 RepID=A0A2K1L9D1_PHYPA|nr:hypothetical protein PHYPA_001072 [Physcomitrium patens]
MCGGSAWEQCNQRNSREWCVISRGYHWRCKCGDYLQVSRPACSGYVGLENRDTMSCFYLISNSSGMISFVHLAVICLLLMSCTSCNIL